MKKKVLILNISEHQIYDYDHDKYESTMCKQLAIIHAQVEELDQSQLSNRHKAAMKNTDYIYK